MTNSRLRQDPISYGEAVSRLATWMSVHSLHRLPWGGVKILSRGVAFNSQTQSPGVFKDLDTALPIIRVLAQWCPEARAHENPPAGAPLLPMSPDSAMPAPEGWLQGIIVLDRWLATARENTGRLTAVINDTDEPADLPWDQPEHIEDDVAIDHARYLVWLHLNGVARKKASQDAVRALKHHYNYPVVWPVRCERLWHSYKNGDEVPAAGKPGRPFTDYQKWEAETLRLLPAFRTELTHGHYSKTYTASVAQRYITALSQALRYMDAAGSFSDDTFSQAYLNSTDTAALRTVWLLFRPFADAHGIPLPSLPAGIETRPRAYRKTKDKHEAIPKEVLKAARTVWGPSEHSYRDVPHLQRIAVDQTIDGDMYFLPCSWDHRRCEWSGFEMKTGPQIAALRVILNWSDNGPDDPLLPYKPGASIPLPYNALIKALKLMGVLEGVET